MFHNLIARNDFDSNDFTVLPHTYIKSFSHWDMTMNYPCYQIFIFQNHNLEELDQEDINMRSKIYMTLLTHTEKFIVSLLQIGKFNKDKSIFYNDIFAIATKHLRNIPIGSWQMCVTYENKKILAQYSDIIAFYALVFSKSYKQAVHIINDHIEQSRNLFTASQNKAGWFIQEKNPISMVNMDCFEDFTNALLLQTRSMQRYVYKNKHGIPIAICIKFVNSAGEYVTIFYTIQRRYDSPLLYFAPLPPEPPYTIYKIEKITKTAQVVCFQDSEDKCGIDLPDQYINVTCPYGLSNLDKVDFSPLFGKEINISWDKSPLQEDYLLRLKNKAEEMNIQLNFIYDFFHKIDINSLLNTKEFIIPLHKDDKHITNYLSRPGEKIYNQDRVRRSILSPIIESGTITWLFSAEKVGKTLVSLSIAYAVGKGNKTVGQWTSTNPMQVLYIDGEMPGDKIASLCESIMQGYGDNSGHHGRPFSCYPFSEHNLGYESILDEEWLKCNKKLLFCYDLVIFDNYYSLNNNRIDIKPFLKLLKELTSQDIAVIVVDHTNADGELQGSHVKRRAADLGIKLENIDENTISIDLTFDRYGKSTESPTHHVQKFFYTNQFTLVPVKKNSVALKEDMKKTLTQKDKKLLYSLILNKSIGIKQNLIAAKLNIDPKRVSEYIVSARAGISGIQPDKYKISDISAFKSEYTRISSLPKEKILNEFSCFCQDMD